jgi:hypothetical protein
MAVSSSRRSKYSSIFFILFFFLIFSTVKSKWIYRILPRRKITS